MSLVILSHIIVHLYIINQLYIVHTCIFNIIEWGCDFGGLKQLATVCYMLLFNYISRYFYRCSISASSDTGPAIGLRIVRPSGDWAGLPSTYGRWLLNLYWLMKLYRGL